MALPVPMAVQDQLGTLVGQQTGQLPGVSEPFAPLLHSWNRGMVQVHNPEQTLPAGLLQYRTQPLQLFVAQPAAGHEWWGRAGRGEPYECQLPAEFQGWILGVVTAIPGEVVFPLSKTGVPALAHTAFVVARYQADVGGLTHGLKPTGPLAELCGHADVGEVPGDDRVLAITLLQVSGQGCEHFRLVFKASFAAPGQVAQDTFIRQLPG